MSGYLPYRYFNSDYLHHGFFPFWNPFQRFGYPAYSDLQSGLWYPPVWLLMLTGKYTITQLILEQIFVFIVAGLGMFLWIKSYLNCNQTAFVAGLSYALSGFMFGSNHLMVFTIGYAWFPFSILVFYNYYKTQQIRYILLNAVFIALTITGASPAYSIILVYIYFGLYAFLFYHLRANTKQFKKVALHCILLGFLSIVLTLPYILSFYDFMHYFNRLERLPYQEFVLNPLTLPNFISFFFPYTVVSGDQFFHGTDLSLRNIYIGFLPAILFFLSIFLFSKQLQLKRWFIFTSLFILLSLGDELFIYRYIYELPGFGLFRHPSFFRGYVIFGAITIVSFYLKKMWFSKELQIQIKKVAFTVLSLLIIIAIFSVIKIQPQQIIQLKAEILQLTEFSSLPFLPHFLLNVAIVIFILILFLLLNLKFSIFKSFIFCLWIDLFIQVSLAIPSTLCFIVPYSEVKAFFNALPESHNQAYNTLSFKELTDSKSTIHTKAIWENKPVFEKYPASTGVNPFRFKHYDEAKNNGNLSYHLENPLFFFPKTNQKQDTLSSFLAWNFQTSLVPDSFLKINNIKIGYNSFSATVSNYNSLKGLLILNQNYHHLWSAFLDKEEIEIIEVSDMVMGVDIPKGENMKIEFSYHSNKIYIAAIIGFLAWIVIVISYLILKNNDKNQMI
jgi:hypothetical protein